MKTINIDFDYLIFAYQDDSPDNIYYLDTDYGDVRLVHRDLKDLRDLTDEIEIFHERFLYVPKLSKENLFSDLHHFMETIENAELKRLLAVAFESSYVLDAFKKILTKDTALSKRFENYVQEQSKKRLLTWLAANALTAPTTVPESN